MSLHTSEHSWAGVAVGGMAGGGGDGGCADGGAAGGTEGGGAEGGGADTVLRQAALISSDFGSFSFTGLRSTARAAASLSVPARSAFFFAVFKSAASVAGSFAAVLPMGSASTHGGSASPSASHSSMPLAEYLSSSPQGRCCASQSNSSGRALSSSEMT